MMVFEKGILQFFGCPAASRSFFGNISEALFWRKLFAALHDASLLKQTQFSHAWKAKCPFFKAIVAGFRGYVVA